jgi:23S rRNA (uracil1939-C5)-methyltransferase
MEASVVLRIDGIAAGGAGIGRLDGMATFVPRSAPGDVARVRLRRRKRFAEGRLEAVLSPGADRVAPECPHYEGEECGGCQLQHLAYPAQLVAKQEIVRQALARIGKRLVEVGPVVPSPTPWRYRNKLTLTVRGHGAERRGGLRRFHDPDAVFDLVTCHIVTRAIECAWAEVRAAFEFLPPVDTLRVVLREEPDGVTAVIKGGQVWPEEHAFRARCPSLVRVRHDVIGAAAWDDADVASMDAFAQVNPAMAEEMEAHVISEVRAVAPERVVDAYGGQGRLAGRLVAEGIAVTLIELDPEATRVAERLFPAVEVRTDRVETALAAALPAEVVVVNPPRVGLHEDVCTLLETSTPRPQRVIYVSCDPATLARDLARLPTWRVLRVTPFDLFPHTAHVETVCVLTPENAR